MFVIKFWDWEWNVHRNEPPFIKEINKNVIYGQESHIFFDL